MTKREIPIDTRALFRPLDKKLIELLKSMSIEDWEKQTVAKEWNVHNVASHLLDGSLRTLSIQRDMYFGEQPPEIDGYERLVDWLNQLNADWVKACRRLSPDVLILLLESTGELVADHYSSLDPWGKSIFPVDWAGESSSYNWMHIAREYTEKWHHQQQIRDAVGREGIMNRTFFHPVIDTFFQALPHTFRNTEAPIGTTVAATITTSAGGTWFLKKTEEKWELSAAVESVDTMIEIPAEISWKLFSKSLRPHEISQQVKIQGDPSLAKKVLEMVSMMA